MIMNKSKKIGIFLFMLFCLLVSLTAVIVIRQQPWDGTLDPGYSDRCMANISLERRQGDFRYQLYATLFYSFGENEQGVTNISGQVREVDADNNILTQRTIYRDIYFNYVIRDKKSGNFSLQTTNVERSGLDDVGGELDRKVLNNSFYHEGSTDTFIITRLKNNALLFSTLYSPLFICTFTKIH